VAVAAGAQEVSPAVPDQAYAGPAEARIEQPASGSEATEENVPPFWAGYEREVDRELTALRAQAGDAADPSGTPDTAAAPLVTTIGQGMFSATLKTVYALLIVLLLILLTAFIVPRLSPYLNRLVGRRGAILAGPQLATLLGKVQLTPNAALHFVQAGGRVLLVGVTQNAVSLLAEFDEEMFEEENNRQTADTQDNAPGDFLEEVQTRTQRMREGGNETRVPDVDIDSLRSEIQRLKRYLQETSRETTE
jgi:flagellar biogenesis protein FliO